MLFNSVEFLIFFPIVCLLYYILPHRFRYILILIAGLVFVAVKDPVSVIFLMVTTVITWIAGLLIGKMRENDVLVLSEGILVGEELSGEGSDKSCCEEKTRKAKIWVATGLVAIFGILAYLKYVPYLWSLFKLGEIEVILPIGISFYTFQTATYLLDVYRGDCKVCRNFLKYAAFATFFPTILAGPIERAKNLIPQFEEEHKVDFSRMKDGLQFMLWGYFLKMVIVSRLTILTDCVYGNDSFAGLTVLVAVIFYSFQIYCDFAGYSYIAVGCAQICGFDIMRNFRQPYMAGSVADFWRRWHISLSTWFRDYLYIPLGGNRKGTFRKYLNVMIVFAVSGIWHGANVTFLIWGLLNGAYQVLGGVRKTLFPGKNKSSFMDKLSIVGTFILISITWVFFSAPSFPDACERIGRMFRGPYLSSLTDGTMFDLGLGVNNLLFMILALAILIISDVLCEKRDCDITGLLVNVKWPVRLAVYWLLVTMILFSCNLSTQEFLYMNF